MSRLAQANLRLLLPNRVVSPTPSLHCRYLPCSHTTDAAAGWIISSLLQSCMSLIAMWGSWLTLRTGLSDTTVFSTLLKGEPIPFPFSPPAALFPHSSSLFCPVSDPVRGADDAANISAIQEWGSRSTLSSTICPFLQLSSEPNARIKIHGASDTSTEPGIEDTLKLPKQQLLYNFSLLQGLLQSLVVSYGVGETTYTKAHKSCYR